MDWPTGPSRTADDEEAGISAHWDSYRDSPGADDNGSGVAVLLELARFFSTFEGDMGGTIRFVSFGAEEFRVVGSRAYLDTHHQDLEDVALVFNIDQVGGPGEPFIEMLGGSREFPIPKWRVNFAPDFGIEHSKADLVRGIAVVESAFRRLDGR